LFYSAPVRSGFLIRGLVVVVITTTTTPYGGLLLANPISYGFSSPCCPEAGGEATPIPCGGGAMGGQG